MKMRPLATTHLQPNAECKLLTLSTSVRKIHACAQLYHSPTHWRIPTAHDLFSQERKGGVDTLRTAFVKDNTQ